MAVRIVRDDNNIPSVIEILEELNRTEIHVGIFGADDSHILMIANVNEFGCTIRPRTAKRLSIPLTKEARGKSPRQFSDLTPFSTNGNLFLVRDNGSGREFMYMLVKEVTIPERSFMRGGFDSNQNIFADRAAKLIKQVIIGATTIDNMFTVLDEIMVSKIQQYLTDLSDPPNASVTKSTKNGSNPLVDTGRLRNSITYKVVKK